MRLNHINLPTSDIATSRAFLETYFGLRRVAEPDPDTIVVLADDADCIITLSNLKKGAAVVYPAGFHVGFMQSSREAVDAIHARLSGDGIAVGPRREFHGAWTFSFDAPAGFRIEVGYQHTMPARRAA